MVKVKNVVNNLMNDGVISTELFPNLALKISKDRLKEIGEEVCSGYIKDSEAIGDRIKKISEWLKTFALQSDPKTFPWENCSNVILPIITMACIQYQSRAYENLVPSKNIVKAYSTSSIPSVSSSAERVEKHMNYQLTTIMKEFKESMDVSLMQLALIGTIVRKSYYDMNENRIVSDFVSAADFVVNPKTRYLEKSERYTQVLNMSVNDIKICMQNGKYMKFDLSDEDTTVDNDISIQTDKNNSVTPTVNTGVNARRVLEQHVYLDLSGKDGIKKPYIVIVDYSTGKVLRITSRINPYTGKKMEYFSRYCFLPNPDGGFYGLGFGSLLETTNNVMNTMINMLVDAGVLSNVKGGFLLKGSKMSRGDVSFTMGEFKEVDLNTDDIRKAVMEFNFSQPSGVLFQLLGTLQEYADRLTTVSETITGKMPPSDTAATTVAAVLEQGMKVFSTIHKRVHSSFQKELENIFTLNSLYTDNTEYFTIVENVDQSQKAEYSPMVERSTIQRDDYLKDIQIIPISDPNITSKFERLSKAETMYNLTLSNPVTSGDPQKIQAAFKNLLEAQEQNQVLVDFLVTLPPPPVPPDIPQEEEIREFFNEKYIDALPNQDHEEHLAVIEEFKIAPIFQDISPVGKRMVERHRNQHLGFIAEALLKAQDNFMKQQAGQQLSGEVSNMINGGQMMNEQQEVDGGDMMNEEVIEQEGGENT